MLAIRRLKTVLDLRVCVKAYCCGFNHWDVELTNEVKLDIEKHWHKKINDYEQNDNGRPYYVLSMFPYPSGSLHMGHVRVYTISDAVARFQRLNGRKVIYPIGWDAFGLPAENAAIERNQLPSKWTKDNIQRMSKQLKQLACSFDWDREVATCDPHYYKWTQELFLKLFDSGLVFRRKALVNWDPVDCTVLADEQVDENGFSWRSGARVEKKVLNQWYVRTTKFAKALLDGLDDSVLVDWRDIIKLQQHWIGSCDGVVFDFRVTYVDSSHQPVDVITLWTAYPEYIEHAKFVALRSNHILSIGMNSTVDCTQPYVHRLDNVVLINPMTLQELPVFITNHIDFAHSTDSFVGIPGIDRQASDFATKVGISFESLTPLSSTALAEAQDKMCVKAQSLQAGGFWSSAKLRDWLISRQRYWGTPIPIIHCKKCGYQPVPRGQLPVELPTQYESAFLTAADSGMHLKNFQDWLKVSCPKCSGVAERETDTMDTFVDSSWYYFRYLDPNNHNEMFSKSKTWDILPVDLYVGGKEHAVLHLYYARFISHYLHSIGLVREREPFKRLLVQGMVMGQTFKEKDTGRYLSRSEVEIVDDKKDTAKEKLTGAPVVVSWEKMSKSKKNGTDPDDMFKEFGVDTTRMLLLADVAPTSHRQWNTSTFPGILSWQNRLWLTLQFFLKCRTAYKPNDLNEKKFQQFDDFLFDSRNYYLKGVTFNYCGSQQHSVAISKQQGLTNSIRRSPDSIYTHSVQFERALATQIIMLAPMAPHFASELWAGFCAAPHRLNDSDEIDWNSDVLQQTWPKIDEHYQMSIIGQVNEEDVCYLKVTKRKLKDLSHSDIVTMLMKDALLLSITQQNQVIKTMVRAPANYDVTVNFKTKYTNYSLPKKWKLKKKAIISL